MDDVGDIFPSVWKEGEDGIDRLDGSSQSGREEGDGSIGGSSAVDTYPCRVVRADDDPGEEDQSGEDSLEERW